MDSIEYILLNTHIKACYLLIKYKNILVYPRFECTPRPKEIPRILHAVRKGNRRRRFRPYGHWPTHRGDRFKLYMNKYPSCYTLMYFTLAIYGFLILCLDTCLYHVIHQSYVKLLLGDFIWYQSSYNSN